MKMKRIGKLSLIFEFDISKLGYVSIFMKIWKEKKTEPFFETFLTNRGKNENENEKSSEKDIGLWILHIKIRLYGYFHENVRTIFFLKFLP